MVGIRAFTGAGTGRAFQAEVGSLAFTGAGTGQASIVKGNLEGISSVA